MAARKPVGNQAHQNAGQIMKQCEQVWMFSAPRRSEFESYVELLFSFGGEFFIGLQLECRGNRRMTKSREHPVPHIAKVLDPNSLGSEEECAYYINDESECADLI